MCCRNTCRQKEWKVEMREALDGLLPDDETKTQAGFVVRPGYRYPLEAKVKVGEYWRVPHLSEGKVTDVGFGLVFIDDGWDVKTYPKGDILKHWTKTHEADGTEVKT